MTEREKRLARAVEYADRLTLGFEEVEIVGTKQHPEVHASVPSGFKLRASLLGACPHEQLIVARDIRAIIKKNMMSSGVHFEEKWHRGERKVVMVPHSLADEPSLPYRKVVYCKRCSKVIDAQRWQ